MTTPTPENEQAAYAAIDDALRTFPQRPAPPGLAPGVMRRVRRLAPPRFRLNWLDLALCAFGASMAALALALWQAAAPALAPPRYNAPWPANVDVSALAAGLPAEGLLLWGLLWLAGIAVTAIVVGGWVIRGLLQQGKR